MVWFKHLIRLWPYLNALSVSHLNLGMGKGVKINEDVLNIQDGAKELVHLQNQLNHFINSLNSVL